MTLYAVPSYGEGMDTVAPACGLSAAPPDPFGDEALAAWAERQLDVLREMQALGQRAAAVVVGQIERIGDRTGSLTSALSRLFRGLRLCMWMVVRLTNEVRRWRSGAVAPAVVAKAPAPAVAMGAGGGAAAATAAAAATGVIGTAMADEVSGAMKRKLSALYERLGAEEFEDELAGASNAQVYQTICKLLGVAPDPTLFGPVVTVDPAGAGAPAESGAVPEGAWAREMSRDRAREAVEAEFGPPPRVAGAGDWAIRVGSRGDPPGDGDPP